MVFPKGDLNPAKRPKVRELIRLSKLGKKRLDLSEKYKCEGNPNWKGDNVKYGGIHKWVRMNKPKPEFCECCNKVPPFDLANISGEYKRDLLDYKWLCRSCHSKQHRGKEWHNRIIKFKIGGEKWKQKLVDFA